MQQRARSPAVSGRAACRPDIRRHQHARPERRGIRPLAGRQADGDFHDGLLGICRRRVQARRRGLPAQTLQFCRLQPLGGESQFALRTAPQPACGSTRGYPRSPAQRQGIHLRESGLQGFAGQDQRHRVPGKRRGVRADAPCRRHDDHHAFPAQEHGGGTPVGYVHARAPFLHRQPALHQRLCPRPRVPERYGIRPHR